MRPTGNAALSESQRYTNISISSACDLHDATKIKHATKFAPLDNSSPKDAENNMAASRAAGFSCINRSCAWVEVQAGWRSQVQTTSVRGKSQTQILIHLVRNRLSGRSRLLRQRQRGRAAEDSSFHRWNLHGSPEKWPLLMIWKESKSCCFWFFSNVEGDFWGTEGTTGSSWQEVLRLFTGWSKQVSICNQRVSALINK